MGVHVLSEFAKSQEWLLILSLKPTLYQYILTASCSLSSFIFFIHSLPLPVPTYPIRDQTLEIFLDVQVSLFFFFNIYFFIWLRRVLVVACGILC